MNGKLWIVLMIVLSVIDRVAAERDYFNNKYENTYKCSLTLMQQRIYEADEGCLKKIPKYYKCIFKKIASLLAKCNNKGEILFDSVKIKDLLMFTQKKVSLKLDQCNRAYFEKRYISMCSKFWQNNTPLYYYCREGEARFRKLCFSTHGVELFKTLIENEPFYQELLASSNAISKSLGKQKTKVDLLKDRDLYRELDVEQRRKFVLQCCELDYVLTEELHFFDLDQLAYKQLNRKDEVLLKDRCKVIRNITLKMPIAGASCWRLDDSKAKGERLTMKELYEKNFSGITSDYD